jgi:hypothetical protein
LPVPGAGFTFSTPDAALLAEAVVVPELFDGEEEFDEVFAVDEPLLMSVQQVSDNATSKQTIAAGRFLFVMMFPLFFRLVTVVGLLRT